MGENPKLAAKPLSKVLTFNSLKKVKSRESVIITIAPIIQSDLGPKSVF